MVDQRLPTAADEICSVVAGASGGLLVRGAGTKPALSGVGPGVQTVLDVTGVSGIVDYQPSEYTITALAGTPVKDLSERLAESGQFLPFDPLLAEAGATVGGTIAAGTSGPGRLRFGGVRDFLLGVSFVDGNGRLAKAGGRVVKNAAGFDLPKLMVGSLGRLGVLVEATFKVFPRPQEYATLRIDVANLTQAIELLDKLLSASFDLAALDLVPPGSVLLRIGGFEETLEARLERLAEHLSTINAPASVAALSPAEDEALWRERRELAWCSDAPIVAKLAVTSTALPPLCESFGNTASELVFTAGCQVLLSWSGEPAELHDRLCRLGMRALVMRGQANARFLGVPDRSAVMQEKIERALDPQGRFEFETDNQRR